MGHGVCWVPHQGHTVPGLLEEKGICPLSAPEPWFELQTLQIPPGSAKQFPQCGLSQLSCLSVLS